MIRASACWRLRKRRAATKSFSAWWNLTGKPAPNVTVSFAGPITAAREVNAQEQPMGDASVTDGALVTSFTAYQPRTFALKLGSPTVQLASPHSQPVTFEL